MGVDNRINELRGINGLTDGKGDMVKSPKDVIEKGLEKAFPQISKEEKEIAVRKVAMNEDGKVSIGGKEINVGELDFAIATSWQNINAETDPRYEYFEWIDEGIEIIKDMNTNGVTADELKHKIDFLNNLDQREIELKTCILLYSRAAHGNGHMAEMARKKIDFLKMKWARLMEIRSAIKNSTKNRVVTQEEINEQERDQAKIYLLALYTLREGREISERLKTKLEMNYGGSVSYSLAEQMKKDRHLSREETIERINLLRGRQAENNKPELAIKKQRFNSVLYEQLRARQLVRS